MSKGIYIHIPFCVKKCLYCDFCSTGDTKYRKRYVDALIDEIKDNKGAEASTVFIGGGTPTVLGDELVKVIDAVCENFVLLDNYEFTVEANPGTVSEELFVKLRKRGVNRISIGVQSFNDDELKALGRIHTASEAKEAFLTARRAGFDNINLDIMLSTPKQSMESIKNTIDNLRELDPEHVSAYSLIIEEGTPFYDMELDLPDEDEEREIYYYTVNTLKQMGLERYEISNFAKKGFESRHNVKYWTGEEYIGLGASAHSYSGNYRYCNTSDIKSYIENKGRHIECIYIDKDEKLKEKFLLGLRMSRGVLYNGEFSDKIEKLIAQGLIEKCGGYVRLTKRGFDLGNLVFTEFV